MSNKFNLGDKVETIAAYNETELKMGPYAWASGRDLTGEFKVQRYCGTGNGAVCIAPVDHVPGTFLLPIWVHESELKLVTEPFPAPTPVVAEITLELTEGPTGPTGGPTGHKGPVGPLGEQAIDIHNEARVKFSADKDLALGLVKASFEGKQMQYFCELGMKWEDVEFPMFHVASIYRVKPELTPAQQRVIELQAEIAELQANM